MTDHITPQQFEDGAGGTEDWRVLGEGACTFFPTGSFAAGARFVQAIGKLAGIDDHPPAVDVRPDGVTVRLITQEPEYRGMTERDVRVARQISATARDLGLTADPSAAQTTLLIPGAPDPAAVMPFWRAVLGYDPRPDSPDEDLVDPRDRNPSLWFEQMDKPRADGGGAIHVAVWVPYEQAEARVAAALAAGGRLVRDDFAPAWWTLADAAGNEADVATTRGRTEAPCEGRVTAIRIAAVLYGARRRVRHRDGHHHLAPATAASCDDLRIPLSGRPFEPPPPFMALGWSRGDVMRTLAHWLEGRRRRPGWVGKANRIRGRPRAFCSSSIRAALVIGRGCTPRRRDPVFDLYKSTL